MSQQFLQPQSHHKPWEASFLLCESLEKLQNAGLIAGFINSRDSKVILRAYIGAIPEKRVNCLVIQVGNCMHEWRISQFVLLINICSPQYEQLNQGEVIDHCCNLQRVISVFFINYSIDGEALLQQSHDLLHIVGGDSSEHAIAHGVREDYCILAVPRDLIVVIGDVVEQKWIWSVTRKSRPPFVEIEGKPLRWTEDCFRDVQITNQPFIDIQHLQQYEKIPLPLGSPSKLHQQSNKAQVFLTFFTHIHINNFPPLLQRHIFSAAGPSLLLKSLPYW